MKSIFREYDIRGIFQEELNENIVKKIGYFLGQKIDKTYVLVSYDARIHSPTLANWLISGFNKAGKKVIVAGMLPTGAHYFGNFVKLCLENVGAVEVGGGVQITGSHNPPQYNGFKITINKKPFFGEEIYKLGDEVLQSDIQIEDNHTIIEYDLKRQYIDYIINQFSHLQGLENNFVFDCGNGVAGVVLREILDKLRIKNYKILYENPDGTFPNHHPDPSEEANLEDIKQEIIEYGFAYDGDADRVAFMDTKYNYKGDILALFFAKNMQNPLIISEVKATQIMYDEIDKIGQSVMYKTGHSNLKVKIKELNADMAAEVSGHIFFNDRYFGIDDAIYVTFRIMELIKDGFEFDKEYENLPKIYNTDEIKIKTSEDEKFVIIEKLKKKLDSQKENLQIKQIIDVDGVRVIFENGWGLVRASNTTPVIVTRFEANTKEALETIQQTLMDLLEIR
ncbi:MAG: phosphomannomutase/phosphoglucomutase [Epsilonproteobacteria bacterium]|nr:phosphomannomutase/phosphoglucomutase [Campylobacterota bacterium]